MILDEVRKLKAELLEVINDMEVVEADLVHNKLKAYGERLIALLNNVNVGSDFRVAFRKEGEKKWTNILSPGDDEKLRSIAFMMILERLWRRAAKDGVQLVLVEEVDA